MTNQRHSGANLLATTVGAVAMLMMAGALAPVTATDPQPAAVPSQPQQTIATFGDWVTRCQRVGDGSRQICEAAQSLMIRGQSEPIAQVAVSLAERPGTITILLPTSIAFDKPPQVGTDEAHMLTLSFRRCVPGGCLADARLDAAGLGDLRAATKPGRLIFTDAAEHTVALPLSFRGLPQALDDLARQTASK